VAAGCPTAATDARVLGGALPAEARAPDVGAAAVGVGLRVRDCVAVVVAEVREVGVSVVVAEVREVGVVGVVVEVTVTVVGWLVGCGPGELFPPRMDSPVPPDSGPPLTVSSKVTVARLAAKTTAAAAAAASTMISGRRDRRGVGGVGRPALGMTIVGSSYSPGGDGWDAHGPAAPVAALGVAGVAPAGRTSRSAFVIWRRVISSEWP
jgi:hypothetical protein